MVRDPDEEGLFLKGQPFGFEEAVDAYTINVAKERRIDDEFGSIEVGKSADFVVWNVDAFVKKYYDLIEPDIEKELDKSGNSGNTVNSGNSGNSDNTDNSGNTENTKASTGSDEKPVYAKEVYFRGSQVYKYK